MEEQQTPGTEKRRSQADTTSGSLGQRVSAECASASLCPLHFAIQRLAQTAVSQLVFYAEGEYAPRPDLMDELERWQRLHRLIAYRICPASRTAGSGSKDLDVALALIPETQFSRQREMLARCACAHQGESCPLDDESGLWIFASH